MKGKELIQQTFERMTGIADAWTNPTLMQTRNGFIQGWEAGVAAEREACAKIAEKWSKRSDDVGGYICRSIRARGEE